MSRNTKKPYVEGGFYHVYDRGVNHEHIFQLENDYNHFINLLERYLLPASKYTIGKYRNFSKNIELIAFCLMPTHFHLLLGQTEVSDLPKFMQSLLVSYTKKFNFKYKRFGYLFQDRYCARLIDSEFDLMNVSRYIHLNPSEQLEDCKTYPYSSIGSYVNSQINSYSFIGTTTLMAEFGNSVKEYTKFLSRR